jgi:16S rRNA (adenine1518-N6/adenine1519-N6)-dimethyltransferase
VARQKLGQHFLASGGILEKIAIAACGERAGLAVEIGPGRGALTARLLAHADRVIAIELDAALVAELRARWRGDDRLEVRLANAIQTDFAAFGSGVLAGNLPYYAATAIISRYLDAPGELRHGVFLIQKEVARRMVAAPGSRDFGYLSVECQYLAETEYLFTVPPGAFHPPPKVDSAVVRLTPRKVTPGEADPFLKFVSACFRQKRKTLRNNLSGQYSRTILDGMDGLDRRAEELPVGEFMRLFLKSLDGLDGNAA